MFLECDLLCSLTTTVRGCGLDIYSCYLSSCSCQRLQGEETKVRRTPHSLTHHCLLTGVRTSVQTTGGLRWRCSSTTDITATSAIASLWTDPYQTWGLMSKTAENTRTCNTKIIIVFMEIYESVQSHAVMEWKMDTDEHLLSGTLTRLALTSSGIYVAQRKVWNCCVMMK